MADGRVILLCPISLHLHSLDHHAVFPAANLLHSIRVHLIARSAQNYYLWKKLPLSLSPVSTDIDTSPSHNNPVVHPLLQSHSVTFCLQPCIGRLTVMKKFTGF